MSFWRRVRASVFGLTPAAPPGYCPKCGRPRRRIGVAFGTAGPLYVPPNAWELEHLCLPQSCEWYGEPSVPEDPHVHVDKPRTITERLDDIQTWVRRSREERRRQGR